MDHYKCSSCLTLNQPPSAVYNAIKRRLSDKNFDHAFMDFVDDHPFYMKIFDNRTDYMFAYFIDYPYHVLPKLCFLLK